MNNLQDFFQTATAAEVRETLDFLLNECSLDDLPSREEVQQWQHDLQQRGGKFAHIAHTLCTPFLSDKIHESIEK